jgi:hypothetical protein
MGKKNKAVRMFEVMDVFETLSSDPGYITVSRQVFQNSLEAVYAVAVFNEVELQKTGEVAMTPDELFALVTHTAENA